MMARLRGVRGFFVVTVAVAGLASWLALPEVGAARPTAPPCSLRLAANIVDRGSIGVWLSWETGTVLPSDYTVERSADGIAWAPIATVAAPSTTCSGWVQYRDEGLDPLTTYYYRVTGDALASNIASVTTSPPPVAVQPVGD